MCNEVLKKDGFRKAMPKPRRKKLSSANRQTPAARGLKVTGEHTRLILEEVKRMGELNGRVDEDQFTHIVERVTGAPFQGPPGGREGSA